VGNEGAFHEYAGARIMKKYLIVFIAGILLVPAAVYLYLRSGYAPVSTSASPLPFERFFARLAMRATLSREEPKTHVPPPTEADLVSGARVYRNDCAVCHGLPNQQETAIAAGMYPHPPQFFRPGEASSFDPGRPFHMLDPKAYWKIKNGVRLTGMPGFKHTLSEQQILAVSEFVSNARALPPSAVSALEGENPAHADSSSDFDRLQVPNHK
jgi:thiosulfate dehydrogenase